MIRSVVPSIERIGKLAVLSVSCNRIALTLPLTTSFPFLNCIGEGESETLTP